MHIQKYHHKKSEAGNDFRSLKQQTVVLTIDHITSQDHIFKGLCEFAGGVSPTKLPPCHICQPLV